jgi:glycosyltransferase involved in cell wall biosynthesis
MKILILETGSLSWDVLKPRLLRDKIVMIGDSIRRGAIAAGGASRATYQLYRHFSSVKGNEVDFLADITAFTTAKPITIAKMMDTRYDLVLMNSLRDVMMLEEYVRFSGHKRPKSIYFDRVNSAVNFSTGRVSGSFVKRFAIGYLVQRLVMWLDCYVAITAQQKEYARRMFSGRTHVELIPIAPDAEFRRLMTRKTFSGAICVSRLDERQKKIMFLLSGIAEVLDEHPDLRGTELLRIYGSGKDGLRYRAEAERLGISKNIRFIGAVYGKKLVVAYNNAGFLVSTSEWESPGRAFLEGMACGLPLLLNDRINAAVRDENDTMVKDGVNGLIYKHEDLQDFALKFYRLYSENGMRAKLSANALKSSKRYSLKSTLRSYDKLVSGLFGGKVP